MPVHVVIGAQWGDEGKGKIVDLLSEKMDIVARYQGGPNAGHTVVINGEQIILHQVPVGILRPDTVCIIGNGAVVDPTILMDEIRLLEQRGIKISGRLLISHRAHLIMPYHRMLDQAKELSIGQRKIGTTGRGIGPAYVDKYGRSGIRIVDLLNRDLLRTKLRFHIGEKNKELKRIYQSDELDEDQIIAQYLEFDRKMDDYITDISVYLNDAIRKGKNVLAEGAQGTLLDVDFGTYPFVTSSNPIAGGAAVGLGIGPTQITNVIGVIKAYTTRVGEGPFPTEFKDEMGQRIRDLGVEFGATTGRPRRCGWFDALIARYAAMINGVNSWAITKLDVLDSLAEVKICTAYQYGPKVITHFPAEDWIQEAAEPIYESHAGWQTGISGCRTWGDLPENAQKYLSRVRELTQVPISLISVGSDRNETIIN